MLIDPHRSDLVREQVSPTSPPGLLAAKIDFPWIPHTFLSISEGPSNTFAPYATDRCRLGASNTDKCAFPSFLLKFAASLSPAPGPNPPQR